MKRAKKKRIETQRVKLSTSTWSIDGLIGDEEQNEKLEWTVWNYVYPGE